MSLPDSLNGTDEEALTYAIGWYSLGGISIDKAAEPAGVDRWVLTTIEHTV